jgi:hypothetical protein
VKREVENAKRRVREFGAKMTKKARRRNSAAVKIAQMESISIPPKKKYVSARLTRNLID